MQNVFVASKALIEENGKYLFVIQTIGGKSFLDLPGGRIDYGESPKETVVREVKEEVGLDVLVKDLLGCWYFFREIDSAQVICLTFSCDFKGEIDISKNPVEEDIRSTIWLSGEEIFHQNEFIIPEKLKEFFSSI